MIWVDSQRKYNSEIYASSSLATSEKKRQSYACQHKKKSDLKKMFYHLFGFSSNIAQYEHLDKLRVIMFYLLYRKSFLF